METVVYLGLVKLDFTKIKGDWLVSKPLHITHQVAEKETFIFLMCICGVCTHSLICSGLCVCLCMHTYGYRGPRFGIGSLSPPRPLKQGFFIELRTCGPD